MGLPGVTWPPAFCHPHGNGAPSAWSPRETGGAGPNLSPAGSQPSPRSGEGTQRLLEATKILFVMTAKAD